MTDARIIKKFLPLVNAGVPAGTHRLRYKESLVFDLSKEIIFSNFIGIGLYFRYKNGGIIYE